MRREDRCRLTGNHFLSLMDRQSATEESSPIEELAVSMEALKPADLNPGIKGAKLRSALRAFVKLCILVRPA